VWIAQREKNLKGEGDAVTGLIASLFSRTTGVDIQEEGESALSAFPPRPDSGGLDSQPLYHVTGQ
jgi:hypothetical protein